MSNYPLNYARNARKDRLTIAMAVVFPVLFVAGLVVCLFVPWWMVVLLALGLSFLYLSIYALMHEALHGGLHPSPSVNRLLGQWCGLPLLMVFDVVRIAHNMHHSFNRCESQCFDYYYQPQQRWVKNLFWYGILLGGHWVTTILGWSSQFYLLLGHADCLRHQRILSKARLNPYAVKSALRR